MLWQSQTNNHDLTINKLVQIKINQTRIRIFECSEHRIIKCNLAYTLFHSLVADLIEVG